VRSHRLAQLASTSSSGMVHMHMATHTSRGFGRGGYDAIEKLVKQGANAAAAGGDNVLHVVWTVPRRLLTDPSVDGMPPDAHEVARRLVDGLVAMNLEPTPAAMQNFANHLGPELERVRADCRYPLLTLPMFVSEQTLKYLRNDITTDGHFMYGFMSTHHLAVLGAGAQAVDNGGSSGGSSGGASGRARGGARGTTSGRGSTRRTTNGAGNASAFVVNSDQRLRLRDILVRGLGSKAPLDLKNVRIWMLTGYVQHESGSQRGCMCMYERECARECVCVCVCVCVCA
jgi:hypothetical protein